MQCTFAPVMILTEAPFGRHLILTQVLDADLEIKLLELGFDTQTKFSVLRQAPFNGPLTLRNEKTQIIIRGEDAQMIEVSIV